MKPVAKRLSPVTFKVNDEFKNLLYSAACKHRVTISALIRKILFDYIEKNFPETITEQNRLSFL